MQGGSATKPLRVNSHPPAIGSINIVCDKRRAESIKYCCCGVVGLLPHGVHAVSRRAQRPTIMTFPDSVEHCFVVGRGPFTVQNIV